MKVRPDAPTKTEMLSKKQKPPTCTTQSLARRLKSSYFLPPKAAGQVLLYLVDTSCNINLVSKKIFDRLPKHIQDQRMVCDTHGQMASISLLQSKANTH